MKYHIQSERFRNAFNMKRGRVQIPLFTKICTACQCLPQVTDVRYLGFPLDTTFISSVHCREAANRARRLLFCDLSKATFNPLYCAIVRPRLEHAMEANAPKLRADINQIERVQRLATRLVPYEERLRQLNLFSLERRRLQADLILDFRIQVDLSYEGTPINCFKHQVVFGAGEVPSLVVS